MYGLNTLVAKFPTAKRLAFHVTAQQRSKFPFPSASRRETERVQMPDISISFPGQTLNKRTASWSNIACFIDVRSTEEQDPFLQDRQRTVVDLTVNARNLMIAHGLLAAYVVGIYGNNVRIARFDNAGAVVSKDVEPYTIVGGVPARAIKRRFNEEQAAALLDIAWWDWHHDTLRGRLPDIRTLSINAFIDRYRRDTFAPTISTQTTEAEALFMVE